MIALSALAGGGTQHAFNWLPGCLLQDNKAWACVYYVPFVHTSINMQEPFLSESSLRQAPCGPFPKGSAG